jgi:hypothetical protein
VTDVMSTTTGATRVTLSSSLGRLTSTFRAAPAPRQADLVGRFRGEAAGPWWVRVPAPILLGATGMPRWVGKEFIGAGTEGGLRCHNLVERDEGVEPSLPMSARMAPSRLDSRPTLLLTYERDAPLPWRNVTDEVRSLGSGLLLGLSFGILPGVPLGAPFVLAPWPADTTPGGSR